MNFDRDPVFPEGHLAWAPAEPPPAPRAPAGVAGTTSFDKCFFAAVAWTLRTAVVLFAWVGPPTSPDALGAVVGILIVPSSTSAGTTWLVLRRRHAPLWLVLLVCLPSFATVVAVDVVVALVRQGVIH